MKPFVAASPLLRVKHASQGTTDLLTVQGELDISNVADVEQVLARALGGQPETLLLDLAGVEFCDSSGVNLVLNAHHRAMASSTRFRVVPPAGPARRVFDLCRVDDVVAYAK
jgi:anti-sigma B factor antagonist